MTTPTITIEATLTREGLLELRDAIDALLTEDAGARVNPFTAKAAQGNAERKVNEVWNRVGDNAKMFLTVAADLAVGGQEFSMDELAAVVGRDPKTVRSWHRNLGRTLRHVDEAIPSPSLLESRWDGERNRYRMPVQVREAILRRNPPADEFG